MKSIISKANKTAEAREAEALAAARGEKANAIAKQEIEQAQIESDKNVQVTNEPSFCVQRTFGYTRIYVSA